MAEIFWQVVSTGRRSTSTYIFSQWNPIDYKKKRLHGPNFKTVIIIIFIVIIFFLIIILSVMIFSFVDFFVTMIIKVGTAM